jgi:branched-chain amino acid aminotransferase
VTPIIQVDNVKINDGKPGEITKKIQKIYFDTIRGKVDEYDSWLTQV